MRTDCPSRQQDSLEIISKIIVYAIMVSHWRHAANVVPLHGVYMLSYCTSCQQLVTVSFQNWVLVSNVEVCIA